MSDVTNNSLNGLSLSFRGSIIKIHESFSVVLTKSRHFMQENIEKWLVSYGRFSQNNNCE